jgi:hypothetical protein
MNYSRRYSLATLLTTVTLISVGLATYRYLNPPPPYSLRAYKGRKTFFSQFLGRIYKIEVTEDLLARSPKWDRCTANPPLSANEATIKADRVRMRLIAEGKVGDESPYGGGSWFLMAAELTPLNDDLGLWYWVVRFECVVSSPDPPDELRLVVLMDGSVLEPTIVGD